MNTRPNGLHTPAKPVTEREGATAPGTIDWAKPCSDRELVKLRMEKDLDREARNRNTKPAPMRVPGGAA